MKTNQKVRVLRRLGRELIEQHSWEAQEMQAFGAPSECWILINKGNQERVLKVFEQLDIELVEFLREVDRQIEKEAQFTPDYEVPMAHYELMEITEIIEEAYPRPQEDLFSIGNEDESYRNITSGNPNDRPHI